MLYVIASAELENLISAVRGVVCQGVQQKVDPDVKQRHVRLGLVRHKVLAEKHILLAPDASLTSISFSGSTSSPMTKLSQPLCHKPPRYGCVIPTTQHSRTHPSHSYS